MATRRIEVQRKVAKARREAGGCQDCGKTLFQGLMLGGTGPTFSDLVREPGMTWARIEEEIKGRGFMCRGCVNKTTGVDNTGASMSEGGMGISPSSKEPMLRPEVRSRMLSLGRTVPQNRVDEGIPQIGPDDAIEGIEGLYRPGY